jgi:hypothetical protein
LLLGEIENGGEDLDNRYIAVTDVSCMVLTKACFDRVVANYNDESMSEYFDSCRARLREEEARNQIGSDSEEYEPRTNGQGHHVHTAGQANLPDRCRSRESSHSPLRTPSATSHVSRAPLRTPSATSHVSRARWINLVKKAYNKQVVNDSLWYRVGERAQAIRQVAPTRTRSTENSPRGQHDLPVRRAARDDSIGAGLQTSPQMDGVAPKDRFVGIQPVIDGGESAFLKAEMERLFDLMATMCKRMESLETQHVHLHRSLLPASAFLYGAGAAGQVSEDCAPCPEEPSSSAAFTPSQGSNGLFKADDVVRLEDVEGTVTESAQA